jgi:hypothetical protein
LLNQVNYHVDEQVMGLIPVCCPDFLNSAGTDYDAQILIIDLDFNDPILTICNYDIVVIPITESNFTDPHGMIPLMISRAAYAWATALLNLIRSAPFCTIVICQLLACSGF